MNVMKWTLAAALLGAIGIGLSLSLRATGTPAIEPSAATSPVDALVRDAELVARGRYLVQIAGCNDCHTAGYTQAAGQLPESAWLTGDRFGWSGPWGTTYATNLRLFMNELSETQWLQHARRFEPRPPMPWFNVRAMSDEDLRAIYRFVRTLGPAGEVAPTFLAPDESPRGARMQMMVD